MGVLERTYPVPISSQHWIHVRQPCSLGFGAVGENHGTNSPAASEASAPQERKSSETRASASMTSIIAPTQSPVMPPRRLTKARRMRR